MGITPVFQQSVAAVREFIAQNFACETLESFIRAEQWDEDPLLCLNILNDKLTPDQDALLQERLHSYKDKLNIYNYATEVILAWVLEDAVIRILSEHGFQCAILKDRERQIVPNPLVTYDLEVEVWRSRKMLLKILTDFDASWVQDRQVNLRTGIYTALKKEDGILLGFDMRASENGDLGNFFLLPVVYTTQASIKHYKPFGYKPVASISLEGVKFHSLGGLRAFLGSFFKSMKQTMELVLE